MNPVVVRFILSRMAIERDCLSDIGIFFVVPIADNHNPCMFVIRYGKQPSLIVILDRNTSDAGFIPLFLDKVGLA